MPRYKPHKDSMPARAIAYLRGLPAGTVVSEADLGVALRERAYTLRHRLIRAIDAGYINHTDGGYVAGKNSPEAFSTARTVRTQRTSVGVEAMQEAGRQHRGSLREMLMSGAALDVGNPLRELADMMDAARDVLQAKVTSRFSTAEVDVVVARELRAVMDTVGRATGNLRRLREIMRNPAASS